jgi:hypothetical protein
LGDLLVISVTQGVSETQNKIRSGKLSMVTGVALLTVKALILMKSSGY